MRFSKLTLILLVSFLLANCKQNISVKENEFTGINPVAYTDVVYKSSRDTVFVSTFDGKIYEIIDGRAGRTQIANIDDELYNLAYNSNKKEIYAVSLLSGLLVIDTKDGSVSRRLPVEETWAHQICYNKYNGIIATFDFKGNHYLWDSDNNFLKLDTPLKVKGMRPKYIGDNGDVYFDGQGKVAVWNYKSDQIKESKIKGELTDVDNENNYLLRRGKEFAFYNSKIDSLYYKEKHPNWPIYVVEKDTTVNVPLNLEIISSLMTQDNIYTLGLDKSLRKWDKQTGRLIETSLEHKGTPSGMAINEAESQLVTVDLAGKIEFWDL